MSSCMYIYITAHIHIHICVDIITSLYIYGLRITCRLQIPMDYRITDCSKDRDNLEEPSRWDSMKARRLVAWSAFAMTSQDVTGGSLRMWKTLAELLGCHHRRRAKARARASIRRRASTVSTSGVSTTSRLLRTKAAHRHREQQDIESMHRPENIKNECNAHAGYMCMYTFMYVMYAYSFTRNYVYIYIGMYTPM